MMITSDGAASAVPAWAPRSIHATAPLRCSLHVDPSLITLTGIFCTDAQRSYLVERLQFDGSLPEKLFVD